MTGRSKASRIFLDERPWAPPIRRSRPVLHRVPAVVRESVTILETAPFAAKFGVRCTKRFANEGGSGAET